MATFWFRSRVPVLLGLFALGSCDPDVGPENSDMTLPEGGSTAHPGADGAGGAAPTGAAMTDAATPLTDGAPASRDADLPRTDAATPLPDGAPAGRDANLPRTDAASPGTDATASNGDGAAAPDSAANGTNSGPLCGSGVPPGWSLALYNSGLDACPSGFAEQVVFGPPSIGNGACSCACNVAQTGDCSQGTLSVSTNPGHGNDTCSVAWLSTTVSGSQCIPVPAAAQGTLGNFDATPLPGQGGACSWLAQADTTQLSEPPQRFCDVPSANASSVCGGGAPAGFSVCIVSSGSVACPASTPFVHAFSVEDGATLACSNCGACSPSTTCTNATVAAFTNPSCTAPAALTFAVDGTCVLNPNEQAVMAITYSATANSTCVGPASSTATAQLTGARTICCE